MSNMTHRNLTGLMVALALMVTCATAAMAQSASTARIVHTVERGETLYGISHRYNVSPDSIAAYNPSVRNGLKAGQVIIIPGRSTAATPSASEDDGWRKANRPQDEPQPRDERQPAAETTKPVSEVRTDNTDTTPEDPTRQLDPDVNTSEAPLPPTEDTVHPLTIAIIQPFMLEGKATRQAQLTTDFYRGFLLAADTMQMLIPETRLLVYDTRNNTDRLRNYLAQETQLPGADIIIAPDNAEHLAILAEYGHEHGVPVLNNFVVRDSLYQTNPYLLSGNIPSIDMTSVAVEQLIEMCRRDNLTPVMLVSDRNSDKKAFADAASAALTSAGFTPLSISYSGVLTAEDLAGLPAGGQNYIFIPNSATLTEFNRFAHALAKYRSNNLGSTGVRVFGYPEWVTFKTDTKALLHDIEAYIYSRFNPDTESYNAADVLASFRHWYGCEQMDGLPSQALWGFDTGCFILNNLANGYSFRPDTQMPASWNGVQSTFSLQRIGSGSGAVNNAMYIIGYMPGGMIDARVVE